MVLKIILEKISEINSRGPAQCTQSTRFCGNELEENSGGQNNALEDNRYPDNELKGKFKRPATINRKEIVSTATNWKKNSGGQNNALEDNHFRGETGNKLLEV
jgi:hypothetical protein